MLETDADVVSAVSRAAWSLEGGANGRALVWAPSPPPWWGRAGGNCAAGSAGLGRRDVSSSSLGEEYDTESAVCREVAPVDARWPGGGGAGASDGAVSSVSVEDAAWAAAVWGAARGFVENRATAVVQSRVPR